MPRASASDAARTAQEVLRAAIELFASRGFADVSLDQIAGAAGVTRGAVYHHYDNKAGLFRAVAATLQARIACAVVQAADEAGPHADDQLRAGSHAFLEAITSGPAVRILLIDAPVVIGWQEWRRLDAENSATHLREALRRTSLTENLVEASTAQLSGAMNDAALWIAHHDDTDAARAQAHSALDLLLAAYLS